MSWKIVNRSGRPIAAAVNIDGGISRGSPTEPLPTRSCRRRHRRTTLIYQIDRWLYHQRARAVFHPIGPHIADDDEQRDRRPLTFAVGTWH